MSRGKKGTGKVWDVKGKDVPGGRARRALLKGISTLPEQKREKEVNKRRHALDLLRSHAKGVEEQKDRTALWSLVPVIGLKGFPDWSEVERARSLADFLTLAYRGENHIETEGRRDRNARNSERRTCRHSVAEYLDWKEEEGFSAFGIATDKSVLRRALATSDPNAVDYAERRLVSINEEDARWLNSELASSSNLPPGKKRVDPSTQKKNAKILQAWWNWEIGREKERAATYGREPAFSTNPFADRAKGYSKPISGRGQTIAEKEDSRRFYPEECGLLIKHAPVKLRHGIPVLRRLGLRPGEFQHLRWNIDVLPREEGDGYVILIQGGRGRDARCTCEACKTSEGWKPKNGPRRYILSRELDQIGWITPAIDALDAWVKIHAPAHGSFLFPSDSDPNRAWSNQKMNRCLRETGSKAGIEVGMRATGRRTLHSFRHACASEMLEWGVPHPLAAEWIGDSLEVFTATYGRPNPEDMARATLARRIS